MVMALRRNSRRSCSDVKAGLIESMAAMVPATSGESVRYEPLSVLVLPGAAVAAEVTVTDGTGTAVGSVRQGAGTLPCACHCL